MMKIILIWGLFMETTIYGWQATKSIPCSGGWGTRLVPARHQMHVFWHSRAACAREVSANPNPRVGWFFIAPGIRFSR